MAINRQNHRRRGPVRNGRPREPASSAQLDVFFANFSECFSELEARARAGMSRAQLEGARADPDFQRRYLEVMEDNKDRVKAAALREAVRGNKDILKLFLVAYFPEEFGPQANLNLNVDVTQLSEEELKGLVEAHRSRSRHVQHPGGPG
jgi:hypothetical protein